MTKQVLQTGSAANDGTGDTLRAAGRKINDNFTELYDFLGTGGSLSQYLTLGVDGLEYGNTNTTKLIAPSAATAIDISLPGIATTLVGTNTTDTLENKTLLSPTVTNMNLDKLVLDDSSGNNEITFKMFDQTGDRTVIYPALANASAVITFNDETQTLTNKTLTNPVIDGSLFDDASNEYLQFVKVAGAGTHIQIQNSTAATNLPKITSAGQTNTNLGVEPAGTGAVRLGKVAFASRLIETGSADSDTDEDTIIYVNFSNTNRTIKLDDGTVDGEWKIVHNKTAGSSIIDVGSNTAGGITIPGSSNTTVRLHPTDVAQFTWDGVDQTWRFIGGADSAASVLI